MKSKFIRNTTLPLMALLAAFASAAEFSQEKLEKMVRELEAYSVKNPNYAYPIKCVYDKENKEPNAYAALEKPAKEGDKPQTKMVVFAGLLDVVSDERLIRAVVAHEISHLSKGHNSTFAHPDDLNVFYTRNQELEADATGAWLLQRAGYSKQDMVDMLKALDDKLRDKGGWLENLQGDHPSSRARMAAIEDNPAVSRALMDFDAGLAFMEARSFAIATRMFDRAIAKEPKLLEAYSNAALASTMGYYDNLSDTIKATWFRPDFGPMLTSASVAGRGATITELDRRNYLAATQRVAAAEAKLPNDPRVQEIKGVLLVLDPDAKPEALQQGVKILSDLMGKTMAGPDKLRIANNIAVGQQRSGSLNDAINTMVKAERATFKDNKILVNTYIGLNLGEQVPSIADKTDAAIAATVMAKWLRVNSSDNPKYAKVSKNYMAFCEANKLVATKLESAPGALCRAVALWSGSKQFSLFDPVENFTKALGSSPVEQLFDPNFKDLKEMRWLDGDFAIMASEGQALRLTTYAKDGVLVLKPADLSDDRKLVISVGDSLKQLDAIVPSDSGEEVSLVRGNQLETWLYFPELNFGVCVKDDKIVGITVTPVAG
ncbi:MAG: M48 family metalloprotease [Fimbriimonadaceae bacterium]|nr:M48 family metalloprotease [Fimbriimonadaceae bacterium]